MSDVIKPYDPNKWTHMTSEEKAYRLANPESREEREARVRIYWGLSPGTPINIYSNNSANGVKPDLDFGDIPNDHIDELALLATYEDHEDEYFQTLSKESVE